MKKGLRDMVWELSERELDGVIARYEWFTTARRARALLSGKADLRLTLPLTFSPTVPPRPKAPAENPSPAEAGHPQHSADEAIIDRFLELGSYRIVPDEGAGEQAPDMAQAVDDDGLLTEELAEIYRSQGLYAEAREIYSKLSLLNPEKSIYFADAIDRIEGEKHDN